ncbi:hypothetical protein GGX14DRAFT_608842 [Mycena pura]|uniref:Zn(2)-C6 fungal-type domain-containing protein n=1 Tax=Mycena pura TaxID=153505 RepID=A0AAD6Y2L4_9AGAR|nr:hypothetical protein GGX14DRAFT_619352 [Mycena pura]KAJ7189581.1 hypothetical protein GGX14DRAFT_608842 [Mycena pura]
MNVLRRMGFVFPKTFSIFPILSKMQKTREPSWPKTRRSRRVYIACLNCRKRKTKCITDDDAEEKPCKRCVENRLECKYIPVNQEPGSTSYGQPEASGQGRPRPDDIAQVAASTPPRYYTGLSAYPVQSASYGGQYSQYRQETFPLAQPTYYPQASQYPLQAVPQPRPSSHEHHVHQREYYCDPRFVDNTYVQHKYTRFYIFCANRHGAGTWREMKPPEFSVKCLSGWKQGYGTKYRDADRVRTEDQRSAELSSTVRVGGLIAPNELLKVGDMVRRVLKIEPSELP